MTGTQHGGNLNGSRAITKLVSYWKQGLWPCDCKQMYQGKRKTQLGSRSNFD